MSKLFANFGEDPRIQRQALASKYSAARVNLLLVVIFSLVNIITLSTGLGAYLLFSATVPYIIVDIAMTFCGMYPEEFYEEIGNMVFLDKSLFTMSIIIAVCILAIYFLCWLFSKKGRVNWLKLALVLIGIDTVVLVLSYGFSALIDLGFHIWIIYMLYSGIKAHKQMSNMPKENFIEGEFTELPSDDEAPVEQDMIEAPEKAENSQSNEENTGPEADGEANTDGFDTAKGPLDL